MAMVLMILFIVGVAGVVIYFGFMSDGSMQRKKEDVLFTKEQEIFRLTQQVDTLRKKLTEIEPSYVALREEKGTQEESRKQAMQELADLKSFQVKVRTDIEMLSAENATLKERLLEKEREIKKLGEELRKLKSKTEAPKAAAPEKEEIKEVLPEEKVVSPAPQEPEGLRVLEEPVQEEPQVTEEKAAEGEKPQEEPKEHIQEPEEEKPQASAEEGVKNNKKENKDPTAADETMLLPEEEEPLYRVVDEAPQSQGGLDTSLLKEEEKKEKQDQENSSDENQKGG